MKRKTRNNTGLAARHGVKVRAGSADDLGIFLSLYEETISEITLQCTLPHFSVRKAMRK